MKKLLSLTIIGLVSMALYAQYPSAIYMCGDGTAAGWTTDGSLPMYTNGDGTYEYVGDFYNGEFKMLTSFNWEPSFGPVVGGIAMTLGEHKLAFRATGEDPDNKFTVTAGRYQVILSLLDSILTVADGTGLPDKNGIPKYPANLYMVGSGCGAGWSPENAIAFTTIKEGVYELTTTLYGHTAEESYNEIKFLQKQAWGGIQFGAVGESEDITGDGTYSIAAFDSEKGDIHKYHNTCTRSINYNIIVNLEDSTLTLKEVVTPLTTLYMIGDAVGGWNFDENGKEMTLSQDSVFTFSGELSAGEFKFCAEKYYESETWGATEDNKVVNASGNYDIQKQEGTDHKFVIASAAKAQITLNIKTKIMQITLTPTTGLKNINQTPTIRKTIKDGQILILHGDKRLSILGTIL